MVCESCAQEVEALHLVNGLECCEVCAEMLINEEDGQPDWHQEWEDFGESYE